MSGDRLQELRDELDTLDEVPLEDRPALFDRVQRTLVAELNALEEV